MKKLFSFVCALVCAISLNAQTYYIAGSSATLFGKQWNPAGMVLDKQSDGTWSKTFTTCEIGKEYQFKVTDGTWTSTWGYDALESTPEGVTTNNDGNIVCKTYDANMTVVFNSSTKKITLTGVFTKGEGGEDGDPTASYYMKHNWYGTGWNWKKLTDNGDGTYSIRERYGATGCNWNTTDSDNGSKWIGSPSLVDSPAEGDSAVFTLNPTAETITITKIQGAEVVINYVDITIRVMANAAPTIWWWGAGSKCPNADATLDAEGVKYTYDNQPVMTAVDGKTGWYEWVLKDVNEDSGVTFKINKGIDIVAKQSTCYNLSGTIIDCESTGGEGGEGGEVITLPVIKLFGTMNNWNGVEFVAAEDKKTASVSVELTEATTYEFKITKDSEWLGNNGTMTSENCTGWTFTSGGGNCGLTTTVAGLYLFQWEYATDKLTVVYAINTALINSEVENATVKVMRDGQVLIVREGVTYNMMGQVIQ